MLVINQAKSRLSGSFDREPGAALAHRIRCLLVSLRFPPYTAMDPRCAAGNFSPLFTTNGGSSEVIGPTVGRYGSVVLSSLL